MYMLGTDYLLAISENLESWCARYNVQPSERKCMHCDRSLKTTIPAFGRGWRGLVAPQCACGMTTNFKKVVLTETIEEPCLISVLV